MTTNIGNVAVTVSANVVNFISDMDKAEKSVGKLSDRIRKDGIDTLAKYAVAATAAGAAMVTAMFYKSADVIGAQKDLARSINATTEGVQTLTRAGDAAGVTYEAMAGASGKLNSKLGEAIRIGGAAATELDRLGLSAANLAQMDADERFAAISDRLVELKYDSTQASNSLKNLGIRNTEITGMMLEGGDAIRAAKQQIREYGIAVSEVDAEQIDAAEESMKSLRLTLEGVSNQVAVALSPYVKVLGEYISNASRESGGFRVQIQNAMETGVSAAAKFMDMLRGIQVVYKGLKVVAAGWLAGFISIIDGAATVVTDFLDNTVIRGVNVAIDALNKLPNVEIARVDPLGESDFMKSLHLLAETTRDQVNVALREMHEEAMKPMPSDHVKKFFADAKKASEDAAQSNVSSRNSDFNMPAQNEQDSKGKDKSDGLTKNLQAGTQAMRDELAKRQEIAQIYRDNQLALGASQYAQEVMDIRTSEQVKRAELLAAYQQDVAQRATQREENLARVGEDRIAIAQITAQYDEQEKLAEQIKQAELTQIQEEAQLARQRLREIERQNAISVALSLGQQLMGVMQGQSKRAFEFAKKTALASAAIDGVRSGIAAWRSGMETGGPWAPLVAAGYLASSLLKTGAMIQQIRGMNSSGGGGGGGASSAPAAVSTPAAAAGGASGGGGSQSSQTLTVAPINPNSIFSGAAMQAFGQQIYDYSKDGGKVVFSA